MGFFSKPSPVCGGLGLIVGGGAGCGIVLTFGGSFLDLMVFFFFKKSREVGCIGGPE